MSTQDLGTDVGVYVGEDPGTPTLEAHGLTEQRYLWFEFPD